ncbi:MAG: glycosyltransferase family 4 protein [Syntrophales bacterium]|jgi:glycosyltransferase involved in cell wall biosynthesis|nr:glycosyltransferase family 4 protein [Syntrophales bacterium]MCK9528499.1 glycosyltransferase family 4 protein [Syntrophales bacterium]MDX9923036.1 glycosyltransferase family 4 protein [Syntrophales bacterium]
MKILMFGWEFPPSISGGLGTACRGLTEGLLNQGAGILLVVPQTVKGRHHESLRVIDGRVSVPLDRNDMPLSGTPVGEVLERSVGSLLAPYMTEESYRDAHDRSRETEGMENGSDNDLEAEYRYGSNMHEEVYRYARIARTIARAEDFDIIAAHDWMTIPAGMAAREVSGVPLVIHIHSLEPDRSPLRVNEVMYGIERFGMLAADHVIAVSHYTKKKIVEQYGIAEQKISVIHNAALPLMQSGERWEMRAEKAIKPQRRGRNVLFLGRVTGQKGPRYFLDAAQKVLAEDPDIRFIVAGSGDMMGMMRQGVHDRGIAGSVVFTGFLKGDEVAEAYAMSDLYVMTSVSEPFGITALEAIDQGIPVILSRQSGVVEVLRRCPAVDATDTDTLARTILDVLKDDNLRESIVRDGKEDMAGLTWARQAALMMERYHMVKDNEQSETYRAGIPGGGETGKT